MDDFRERFLKKILSPEERELLPRKGEAEFLAGRFAAKEAFLKALGKNRGLPMNRIAILKGESGKPCLKVTAEILSALGKAIRREAVRIHISISHEKDSAVAFVLIEQAEEETGGLNSAESDRI